MDWKMYFILITVDNIYRIPEASLSPLRGVVKTAAYMKQYAGSAVNYNSVGNGRAPKSNLGHTLFHKGEAKNRDEGSAGKVSLLSGKLMNPEENLKTNSAINNGTARHFEGDDISIVEAKTPENQVRNNAVNTKRKPRVEFRTKEDELENALRDNIYIARTKLRTDQVSGKEDDERLGKKNVASRKNEQNLITTGLSGESSEESLGKGEKTKGVEFLQHEGEEGGGSGDRDENHFELENILKLRQDSLTNRKNKQKSTATHLTSEDEIFGDVNDGSLEGEEYASDSSGKRLNSGVGESGEMKDAGIARGSDKDRESKHLTLEKILKMISDPSSGSDQTQSTSWRELEEFFGSANRMVQTEENVNSRSLRRSSGSGETLRKPPMRESVGQKAEIQSDVERSKNSNPEKVSEISGIPLSSLRQGTLDKNGDQFGSGEKGTDVTNGANLDSAQSQKVAKSREGMKSFEKQLSGPVNKTMVQSKERETPGEIGSTKENNWLSKQDSNISKLKDVDNPDKNSTKVSEETTTTEMESEHGLFRSEGGKTNHKKSDKSRYLKRKTSNSERAGQHLDWKTRGMERTSAGDGETEEENEEEEEEMGDDWFDETHMEDETTERPHGDQEHHWEMQGLGRGGKMKDIRNDRKESQTLDVKEVDRDKEAVTDVPDHEWNDITRNKDQGKELIAIAKEREERQRKIMTHLENLIKNDDCSAQDNKDRQRKIMTCLEKFVKDDKCTAHRDREIMADLENLMENDNCTAQENQDRQRKILNHLESFIGNDNCTIQENQDRQRKIMKHLENFVKNDNCKVQEKQDRQKMIMTHLENFMKDNNCGTAQENQDRQRKIMKHLENFIKNDNCTVQEDQDRQRKIMANLETFMKDNNCGTVQENQDRQRKIMTQLENFMKEDSCTVQESDKDKTSKTYRPLPGRVPGRATYDPIALSEVHNMEQELLRAQREANSELDEVRFEMGRKLSGLEINLGMVRQLANSMDKKIGSAVENALQMTKDASMRAKNKLVQVKEAASAVEVIEQKVGTGHTVNASRTLLSRLPDNPSFKSNKIYQQLLAVNALITKLEGAKVMAKTKAEKTFKEEEDTSKTAESEAQLIKKELTSAVLELSESTAKELQEEREAKAKIREAEMRNAEAYRRASQALTKVERYLAKLQWDETKLSKY